MGLAVDTKNKLIFVADNCYECKIHAFDLTTKKLKYSFTAPYKPNHISIDNNEDTIVMTCMEDQYIVKMSLDGQELIWRVGGNGGGLKEGEIYDPIGVVVDQRDSFPSVLTINLLKGFEV
ncbi:hypothetical protein ABK040_008369 [Willaertia magna]